MDSKELMQENAKVDWMKLVKRHRKKQKGLPALSTLKTNVGPAEPGMSMFNNSVNFDAINGDTASDGCSSGAAMGESFNAKEKLIKAFPGTFSFDPSTSKFVNRKQIDADDDFDMLLRAYPTID